MSGERAGEAQPSQVGTITGFTVTERIDGAHPKHPDYPLLRGDMLHQDDDGTWAKFGPGLAITGFRLTAEQEATLREETKAYGIGGMDYFLGGGGPDA